MLNNVEAGEEVEITRRGREPAVIVSKATFEAYKKAALDAEFASLFDTLDSTNENWLTDNGGISPEELIALRGAYKPLPAACRECLIRAGRAIIGRVQARVAYEEITDLFEVSATYLKWLAEEHIFNDANKRTAKRCAVISTP